MPQVAIAPTTQDLARHGRFIATGGTRSAVVHDGSDATYLRRAASGSPGIYFFLAAPSIPGSNDIATVVPCARIKQPTGTAPKNLGLNLYGYRVGKTYAGGPKVGFPGVFSSAVNVAADASYGALLAPSGDGWLAALAAGNVGIAVDDGHAYNDSNRDYIYELSAAVYYATRPTASVSTSPASPISTTSCPTFLLSISALIEAWQDNVGPATGTDCPWELRVFTAAQYGAGGFDPATSTPYWSDAGTAALDYIDGSTASTASLEAVSGVLLPNGTYRAYARATRPFAGAVAGAWATGNFTVSIALLTTPTISVGFDDAHQRVSVNVTPNASSGAANPLISLERGSPILSGAVRTNYCTNSSFEKFAEKVVFDGDSHTARWEYPSLVMHALGDAWGVENQATGGHTSQDVINGLAAVDALYGAGDVYVLWIGTNDFFQSFSTATTIANIASICSGRRAVGYKVIVCTILPAQRGAAQDTWRDTVNASIVANWATYADGLADIGGDAIIGDFQCPNNPVYFDVGQMHLMTPGNIIAARIVQAALEALPLTSTATGWTLSDTMDGTVVPSPAPAHAGSLGHVSQRLRCVLAAGEGEAAHAISLAWPFGFFDVPNGTPSFAMRVSVASAGVPVSARLKLGFYNAAWGSVGDFYTDLNPVPSEPTALFVTADVPATAVRVYCTLAFFPIVGYTPGQSMDITADDGLFEKSADFSAYFDGSYPGCAFTAEANASPSVGTYAGETWAAVHNATDVPAVFGTPISFQDYAAPRGAAITYRAQVVVTVSAQLRGSAWVTAASTGPACVGWNLKVPDAPTLNMLGALIRKDPDFQQVEDVVEFNVPGRTYPVVVSMALNGIDGGFDIETRTDAEWTLLQAIMAYRGALFLESPFGWGRWIRIMASGGGRSAARKWVEVGTPGDARRRVHLDYREVGER